MNLSDSGAILSWWLIIQALGLAVWPLAFRLFRWLPDRGYLFSKPFGLLLVSYLFWLVVSLHILPNTIVAVLLVFVLVVLGSGWVYRREKAALWAWLREHRWLVIAYELLLVVAFVGWAIFRAHVPDISTSEKPMEIAFFNALGRSTFFPPYDPWLAGYPLAYYYFGYVMLSLFSKLSGVSAGVVFGLGNAFWFALPAATAFAVVANLVLLTTRRVSRAVVFGIFSALLLVLMGNLEAPLEVMYSAGQGSPEMWQQLDILDLNQPAPHRESFPWPLREDPGWWYRAAWLIHDYPPDSISPQLALVLGKAPEANTSFQQTITEFPQFSLLLGDLHPHVMNLAFVLLAVGLALNLYLAGSKGEGQALWSMPLWLTYPITLGGISFMNTWDMPTNGLLLVAAFNLGKWQARQFRVHTGLLDLVLLVGLSWLLYLPFYSSFTSPVTGLWPNLFNGTRVSQFFLMFGPFLVSGGLFVLQQVVAMLHAQRLRPLTFGSLVLGGTVGSLILATGAAAALGAIMLHISNPLHDWWNSLLVQLAHRGITLSDHLLARLSDPWVPVFLACASIVILVTVLANRRSTEHSRDNASSQFVSLLFLLGLLLTLAAEFVYVNDVFYSRKNTLFKLYYQTWTLWSVASAYALYALVSGPSRIRSRAWRTIVGTSMGALIGLGLVYPALAIPTKLANHTPPTLDALLGTVNSPLYPNADDSYAAAQWLNQNAVGTPIILEASDDLTTPRPARSRLSAWTGLPTLVGWYEHETQWRGNDTLHRQRLSDITTIYSTTDEDTARSLLQHYTVAYVLVSDRERKQYPAEGLAKFKRMFPVVFHQGTLTLYRVE